MLQQVDTSNRWLLGAQYQTVAIYQPESLHEKCHLLRVEVHMTTQWL